MFFRKEFTEPTIRAMEKIKEKKNWKVVCQKIRVDILIDIDSAVKERAGMTRSAWILEALQEKLKRMKDVH